MKMDNTVMDKRKNYVINKPNVIDANGICERAMTHALAQHCFPVRLAARLDLAAEADRMTAEAIKRFMHVLMCSNGRSRLQYVTAKGEIYLRGLFFPYRNHNIFNILQALNRDYSYMLNGSQGRRGLIDSISRNHLNTFATN